MNHQLLLNKIREELTQAIREAVEKENNCIGTFYKNRGCRSFLSQVTEEYDDSPIVVAHIPDVDTYGGFIAASVIDLYIDTESCLMCTLNGESGEDWDEPVENVQVEGLAGIVEWLQKNGFLPEDESLREIDEWWKGLGIYSKEETAGLWLYDYNVEAGNETFIADCNKKWNEFTIEQKIEKWKTYKNKNEE
jgi:hypothetical protein